MISSLYDGRQIAALLRYVADQFEQGAATGDLVALDHDVDGAPRVKREPVGRKWKLNCATLGDIPQALLTGDES